MPKCHICKKITQKFNALMKHSDCRGYLSAAEFKFELYKHNYPSLHLENPKFFEDLYITKEYSFPEFNKEFEIHSGAVMFLLKYFNIPSRSIKDTVNSKKYRTKLKTPILKDMVQ